MTKPPKKKILLMGKMAAGKSTIANILVQGNLKKDNLFEIGDKPEGVTRKVSMGTGKRPWFALDTVGLGELEGRGENGSNAAIKLLNEALKEGRDGYDHIAYVVPKGSSFATTEHAKLYKLFKSAFRGAEANFVLIVTHCKDRNWVKDNDAMIQKVFGGLPGIGDIPVVSCDFPFDKNSPTSGNWSSRKKARKDLERQLGCIETTPVVPEVARGDLISIQELARGIRSFLGITAAIAGIVASIVELIV